MVHVSSGDCFRRVADGIHILVSKRLEVTSAVCSEARDDVAEMM